MHGSILISILFFALRAEACTYFKGAEFRAKAARFKTAAAPEHCRREVQEYTQRFVGAPVTMVDSNGGLCGPQYFIATYYCTKRCAALCPSRARSRMLYVKCDPFEVLARGGATAGDVAFSCRCKHAAKPGFCEVPSATWEEVEQEYTQSCIDRVSASVDTSAATTSTTSTTTSTPTTTAATTSSATAATTKPTTATSTAPTTATTTAGAATSTAAVTTAPAATTPPPAPTTTPTPTSTAAESTATTPPPIPPTTSEQSGMVETLSGTLAGEHELYTNLTSELCESQCAEWQAVGADGGIVHCRAYFYFAPVADAGTDRVICKIYSRTRHASPADYVAKPDGPSEGPGDKYGAIGLHNGTYTYVGVCDGGDEQCGLQWTL